MKQFRRFLGLPGLLSCAVGLLTTSDVLSQQATNLGLVGVGRISGDSYDSLGLKIDSLGGIGSAAYFDIQSLTRTGSAESGFTYGGMLFTVPDRGFDGANRDYHPRLQKFQFSITPYYGREITNQSQILLSNIGTTLLTYDGINFTGFEANNTNETSWPQSPTNSVGAGHRSLDPEGLARASDGSWFISDEYGPSILHFGTNGVLMERFDVPDAYLPKRDSFPAANFFGNGALTSGRVRNRGFEGLTITPDGLRLVAALQSPLQQDGNGSAVGRNTRLVSFDIQAGSPTYGRVLTEYVYQLTLNGNAATNRQTLISEILAVNSDTFLVLERDSLGLGDTTTLPSNYKAVVLASTRGATNIANTGYDMERGAPGALLLPTNTVLRGIAPVARQDLVQIIDVPELARFGLNMNTNKDANTLSEKWEGLTLLPLQEPDAPEDFLLLAMNDNDFTASAVYQNGVLVGTNAITIDNMILAYRVRLPGYGAPRPANLTPAVTLSTPTNATFSAPASYPLTATAYDQDGIVTRVEFYEAGVKIGEDTTFPFQLSLTGIAAGQHTYTAIVTDNAGATATSSPATVTVTVENLPPVLSLFGPTNATLSAPARVALSTVANDPDGSIAKVEFFRGATKVSTRTNAPFSFVMTGVGAGLQVFTAIATDNHGLAGLPGEFSINITDENLPPSVSLLTPTNGFAAFQPATVTFTSSANDADGAIARVEYYRGGVLLGQALAAPYLFTVSNFVAGTHTVFARAYDNQGMSSDSAERVVVITDTIPPVIRCPSNVIANCAGPEGTPVDFTVVATDNNSGGVSVICQPPSGSLFPTGTNTVTCVATDSSGNSSTCSFPVIVLPSLVSIESAVIVRWECGEMLQGADSLQGPWFDISQATSPYVVPTSQSRKFYRVRRLP